MHRPPLGFGLHNTSESVVPRRRDSGHEQKQQVERRGPEVRDEVAAEAGRAARRGPPVHVRRVVPREVLARAVVDAAEPEATPARGVRRGHEGGQVDVEGHGAEQHCHLQVGAVRAADRHRDRGERRRAGDLEALRRINR